MLTVKLNFKDFEIFYPLSVVLLNQRSMNKRWLNCVTFTNGFYF